MWGGGVWEIRKGVVTGSLEGLQGGGDNATAAAWAGGLRGNERERCLSSRPLCEFSFNTHH